MYKKEISLDKKNNMLYIKVSYDTRSYPSEKKLIFKESIFNLIPEQYKNKVKLISSPVKLVSNIQKEKYINSGTWAFSLDLEPKQRRRHNSVRKTTTRKKTEEN